MEAFAVRGACLLFAGISFLALIFFLVSKRNGLQLEEVEKILETGFMSCSSSTWKRIDSTVSAQRSVSASQYLSSCAGDGHPWPMIGENESRNVNVLSCGFSFAGYLWIDPTR
uniref:Uncharacterized protein n=1 Tax=Salix viminalis TaxID=40686 RepID=A0A6N2K1Q9_SALVM